MAALEQTGDVADIAREVLALVGDARRSLDDLTEEAAPHAELAGAGLGFLSALLDPLERCRDQVSGDVATLHRQSQEWAGISRQLEFAVPGVRSIADSTGWSGAAARSFTTRMTEFGETVGGAAHACRHVEKLLATSVDLMSGARGLIDDLIGQVVEHMIAAEAAADASAVATAGASQGIALASILARVSEQVEVAIAIVDRVDELLERIADALRSAAAAFVEVNDLLTRVARMGGDVAATRRRPDGSGIGA